MTIIIDTKVYCMSELMLFSQLKGHSHKVAGEVLPNYVCCPEHVADTDCVECDVLSDCTHEGYYTEREDWSQF